MRLMGSVNVIKLYQFVEWIVCKSRPLLNRGTPRSIYRTYFREFPWNPGVEFSA